MTQMYADKTVFYLRHPPTKSPRPSHRVREPRQRRRQLLDMRTGDPIQLPRQHPADGSLLLLRPILQLIDVSPILRALLHERTS